ncbi:MAG TPA: ribose 5-phosphate isomerase B [Anaerolineae bacterium]
MSLQQAEVEALVRQVVSRVLGRVASSEGQGASGETSPIQRPIIDAAAVQQARIASTLEIPANALVTPLARQVALERRVKLETANSQQPTVNPSRTQDQQWRVGGNVDGRTVAIGADHGGYELKEQIKAMLATADAGYTVIDCGTHGTDSVDYPDYAYAVARLVADGRAWRGIMIDGAGIGSCMAANKVPGVRADMCYDQATAVNSREHNNANVLTLGAGLIGPNLARQIVTTWLTTEFGGGRHGRRVDKIDQIGERFYR